MSDFVKQFIENNIEEIDASNWTDVISSWYAEAVELFTYTDAWLDEFQHAMNVIGIDIVAASKSVREDYMYNLLQQYIEAYLDYRTPIKKSSILNSLASKYPKNSSFSILTSLSGRIVGRIFVGNPSSFN